MNIFYAPPGQIDGKQIELLGQEARHAVKVLRYGTKDLIAVVDGTGGWYEGRVQQILNDSIQIKIEKHIQKDPHGPELVIGMGIIKKKDRLEFAVEKAVELGAMGIALFRSEHTIKENIRTDRLQTTALSAMKQSLRAYLPKIQLFNSLENVVQAYTGYKILVAHEKSEESPGIPDTIKTTDRLLLLAGPEGGFSREEIIFLQKKDAGVISLGPHRLRTETAVAAFLSQFI